MKTDVNLPSKTTVIGKNSFFNFFLGISQPLTKKAEAGSGYVSQWCGSGSEQKNFIDPQHCTKL
jgi:hypothetical protein